MIQPYRVATTYKTRADGRPQIIAHTHGPVNPARLTHNVDLSKSADENHHAAALALAIKKSTPRHSPGVADRVSVTEHSSDGSGTRRDWAVDVDREGQSA